MNSILSTDLEFVCWWLRTTLILKSLYWKIHCNQLSILITWAIKSSDSFLFRDKWIIFNFACESVHEFVWIFTQVFGQKFINGQIPLQTSPNGGILKNFSMHWSWIKKCFTTLLSYIPIISTGSQSKDCNIII